MSQSKHCAVALLILLLTSCNDKTASLTPTTAPSTKINTAAKNITTDAWVGKWIGPEGTFIDISGGNGVYTVTIADLDGPKQFQGTTKDNHIIFERNGITETLEASDGAGTGMKWLADKSNCLRLREGEGWCKD